LESKSRFRIGVTSGNGVIATTVQRAQGARRRHRASGRRPVSKAHVRTIIVAHTGPSRRGSSTAAHPATASQVVNRDRSTSSAVHSASPPPIATALGLTKPNVNHTIGVMPSSAPAASTARRWRRATSDPATSATGTAALRTRAR
jgi:hypothetical protein